MANMNNKNRFGKIDNKNRFGRIDSKNRFGKINGKNRWENVLDEVNKEIKMNDKKSNQKFEVYRENGYRVDKATGMLLVPRVPHKPDSSKIPSTTKYEKDTTKHKSELDTFIEKVLFFIKLIIGGLIGGLIVMALVVAIILNFPNFLQWVAAGEGYGVAGRLLGGIFLAMLVCFILAKIMEYVDFN
ncbi:MAG: hypothetical protein FWG64_04320 [Firmicutes bacterium]|nr:hypothetical protein [Bacillota bacterium]